MNLRNLLSENLEFLISNRPEWGRHLRLYARSKENNRVYYAKEIVFEEAARRDACTEPEPIALLAPAAAQQLMDELWKAGVRPTEVGTGGQLEAVKYHLEDMRRIVFRAESTRLPGE